MSRKPTSFILFSGITLLCSGTITQIPEGCISYICTHPFVQSVGFLAVCIQGLSFTWVIVLVSVLFTAQLIRTANQAHIAVFLFCVLLLLDFLAMGYCELLLEIHVTIFSKSKYFLQKVSSFLSCIATNLYLVIYFTISRGIGCAQGTPLSNTLYQAYIYKYFMRG